MNARPQHSQIPRDSPFRLYDIVDALLVETDNSVRVRKVTKATENFAVEQASALGLLKGVESIEGRHSCVDIATGM